MADRPLSPKHAAFDALAALCLKGTTNGEAAQQSRYGFAPCLHDEGHSGDCDSGPAQPPKAA